MRTPGEEHYNDKEIMTILESYFLKSKTAMII